jgi:hypothetical protein
MKKLLSLILVAGVVTFISCGPSAEEKAAMDKARQDSIDKVEKARLDSIEEVNKAAIEKMRADSAAQADMAKARIDSLEAANKKMQKSATDKKKKEEKLQKDIQQQSKGKG